MNPLYQALICCLVKFVFSIRNSRSSFGSFLLPAPPMTPLALGLDLRPFRSVGSVRYLRMNPSFGSVCTYYAARLTRSLYQSRKVTVG